MGGSYRHIADLNEIKCVVETNGFDPVLAIDFQIPEGLKEHGHALILLHESKGAIFDLSTEGGQLMEIEHTRDYGIEHLLFVYQGRSDEDLRITDMLKALLRDMGFWPKPYDCMAELRALVEDFLGRLQESAS